MQSMHNKMKSNAVGVLTMVALCLSAIAEEDESIRWNFTESK